jgi:hypothetical protein
MDFFRYGVLYASKLYAANTSLQWAFYTGGHSAMGSQPRTATGVASGSWEGFRATIVQLAW